MNLVRNHDFAAGLDDWDTSGVALVLDQGGHAGPRCAALAASRFFPGTPVVPAVLSQSVPVREGETYLVSWWWRLDSRPGDQELETRIVLGPAAHVLSLETRPRADWTRTVAAWIADMAGMARLEVRAQRYAATWWIDDVEVVQVSRTREIKDAIVEDLRGISQAAGYSCDVSEVGKEPKRVDVVSPPAVYILPGSGGVSEIEELGNLQGLATQQYVLQLVMKSATPNEDMDNFLDDVRNAIEKSDSHVHGVEGVEMVAVTDWDEVVAPTDISADIYYREATVEVRYLYRRGEV